MSSWSISITDSFLNSSLTLPNKIRDKLPDVIEKLKNNPKPTNGHSVKIKGIDLWRIYVTHRYRLFYKYDNQWVKLLKIVERDKDTYKSENLMSIAEEESLCVIKIDEDESLPTQSSFLTSEQLEHWEIPKEYHERLLSIDQEDDLLELPIEPKWIEIIIDCLPSREKSIEEELDLIDKKAEYVLEESDDIRKYLQGEIKNFYLKLSEEQEKILNQKNDYPLLIKGGPGTGKSILAYYQTKKLLKDGYKKILFTTINPSLIEYYIKPLKALIGDDLQAKGVTLKTVDELASEIYRRSYGERYKLATEEICLFCLKSVIHEITIIPSIKNQIINLGLNYLLDEILIVIESRGIESCDEYLQISRFGLGYKPEKQIMEQIWEIYVQWKKILRKSGYITTEHIRQKALEIINKKNTSVFNAIVIDEAQDLSPVAIEILMKLAISKNKFYLTADTEQSLKKLPFAWDFLQDENEYKGEIRTLNRSFRNTEQIGKAYPSIISSVETASFSNLRGEKPKIILTDDLLNQAKLIKVFFKQSSKKFKLPIYTGVILSPERQYGEFLARQLSFYGLASEYQDKLNHNSSNSCIRVLSLESVKGLEFPFVVVVGLTEGLLPNYINNSHRDEQKELLKQQRQLFYIACSRAMRSLLVFGSKNQPSSFLEPLRENDYWQIEVL
ncbi:hypothetical protein C7H19_15560 [Aphanothece hegewaldii CCALA 016]|uniref:DNA 3'-5' helicase n=1 Tax=Aphanothece hegewaldii CCALA 016 TaxID=2107694 RepID=A0A2T1LV98_9CHRO|nr:3'-5' exonuclease [Aphanothece hegewaldii]PSF35658.1 hypothetical protein C7H19_15560 [Aphanothece hegewaldii CCALA 016]